MGFFKTILPEGKNGKYIFFKECEVPIHLVKILEIENRKNSRNGKEQVMKEKKNFPGLKKHELKLFIKTYSLIFFFLLYCFKIQKFKDKRKS